MSGLGRLSPGCPTSRSSRHSPVPSASSKEPPLRAGGRPSAGPPYPGVNPFDPSADLRAGPSAAADEWLRGVGESNEAGREPRRGPGASPEQAAGRGPGAPIPGRRSPAARLAGRSGAGSRGTIILLAGAAASDPQRTSRRLGARTFSLAPYHLEANTRGCIIPN